MKRWTTLLIVICMLGITIPAMGAMSISKMRQNTRFLTDRMAYELKLTPRQYNDVYEVNYYIPDKYGNAICSHAHKWDGRNAQPS